MTQNIGTVLSALEDLDTTSINNGVLPTVNNFSGLTELKTNATIDLTNANAAQKLYAEQAASSAEGESSEDKEKDDIVDAEFEEV